jgi:hypothetical protein
MLLKYSDLEMKLLVNAGFTLAVEMYHIPAIMLD